MKISKKRKRWLTKKRFSNCLLLSLAIMVIVLVFKLAEMTIYSNLPIIEKIIFFLFVWLFLSFLIWILGFIAPDLMEKVLTMLRFKII